MVMRYLGSMVNVAGSSLGLVTLVLCVILDAGWYTFPAVVGAYLLGAAAARLLFRQEAVLAPDHPTAKPRRAAN
jgi:hypothetical protein